jgi:tripartite-type tricarboxylate transporter receptor subunit TctC
MTMRRLIGSLALAIVVALPGSAVAQDSSKDLAKDWPNRAIALVVGFAAGGGTDVLARIVGRRLSEVLGQQVIIENVGGTVGSGRVAKAAPDGTHRHVHPRRLHQPDALQASALQFPP